MHRQLWCGASLCQGDVIFMVKIASALLRFYTVFPPEIVYNTKTIIDCIQYSMGCVDPSNKVTLIWIISYGVGLFNCMLEIANTYTYILLYAVDCFVFDAGEEKKMLNMVRLTYWFRKSLCKGEITHSSPQWGKFAYIFSLRVRPVVWSIWIYW